MPYLKELCEKFIRWEIGTSTMFIVFGAVLVVIGIVLMIIDNVRFDCEGILICFGVTCFLVGAVVVGVQSYDIITCNAFPEKMLFEYVKDLMQKY